MSMVEECQMGHETVLEKERKMCFPNCSLGAYRAFPLVLFQTIAYIYILNIHTHTLTRTSTRTRTHTYETKTSAEEA